MQRNSHPTTLVARAQGALIGQLVGDAPGSGVDGWSPERIREEYPGGVRQMLANPDIRTSAGQITEKSEMALVLARDLVEHHEYNAVNARREYVEWLNSGVAVRDEAITAALLDDATIENNSNGALLRAAPLGVFGARIWPGVVELWAHQDAMITHPGAVCLAANELFAVAIATAVRQPMAPRSLFESITDYAAGIVVLDEVICRARQTPPANYLERPDIVTVALHNALWQLTHVPSFEEALVHTIAHGGDTAGNAAVCGALLGSVYGIQVIPREWIKAVIDSRPEAGKMGVTRPRPHEYWPAGALRLAEKLVAERAQEVTAQP